MGGGIEGEARENKITENGDARGSESFTEDLSPVVQERNDPDPGKIP